MQENVQTGNGRSLEKGCEKSSKKDKNKIDSNNISC